MIERWCRSKGRIYGRNREVRMYNSEKNYHVDVRGEASGQFFNLRWVRKNSVDFSLYAEYD